MQRSMRSPASAIAASAFFRAHRSGPAAHDGQQEGRLSRVEQAGREHLVDQRAAARLQHAAELTVGVGYVLDQRKDVAAPDQVSGPDLEAEAGGELDGVLAFAAPGVDDHRAGGKRHFGHVSQQRVRRGQRFPGQRHRS